jgi:ATP-dependent helicase HrpA
LIDDVRKLEEKSRRRDVLVSDEGLFNFYSERLPANVYSQRRLERWLKKPEHRRTLFLNRDILMRHAAEGVNQAQFPDVMLMNGTRFALRYCFKPNDPADGVTLRVPLAILNQVDAARCEWLVPGLLLEKVVQLMRSLPKALRRHFVPVAKYANEFVLLREPGEESLAAALARYLEESSGVKIRSTMFSTDSLPDHLLMNFSIVDGDGQEIAMGRKLTELRESLGAKARETFAKGLGHEIEREGITRWIFGDMPETVSFERNGVRLTGYPTIEDCGHSVALRVVDSQERAFRMMEKGLRRLFMLELAQPMSYLRRNLAGFQRMALCFAPVGSAEELKEDLVLAVTSRAFVGKAPLIRREADFRARKQQAAEELIPTANELCALVGEILEEYREVTSMLDQRRNSFNGAAVADLEEQLGALIFKRFVSQIPEQWLVHFPRYLKAIRLRLEKLEQNPAKDVQRAREIQPLWRRYFEKREANERRGVVDPALDHYRWMLEEWRVSLFAQELKTAFPISTKRLAKQWEKVV